MSDIIRKCQICDKKGEKSINVESDDYIYTNGKYYHTQCYHLYLLQKKKFTNEEAIVEIKIIKEKMMAEGENTLYKEKLNKLLCEIYDVAIIPSYFFIKLNKINQGTYKGMSKGITNKELFEMYSNKKFIKKLDKIAFKKSLKGQDRIQWDLAIVVNNYDKYIEGKKKKQRDELTNKTLKGEISQIKKDIQKAKEQAIKEKSEVDIEDIIL